MTLTAFQISVLRELGRIEPASADQLARKLGQRNTGQTRIALGRLEVGGYVTTVSRSARYLWRLTPKGAAQ